VVIFRQSVPVPLIDKPLLMPLRTVFVVGVISKKSGLSFDMQLDAPMSRQIVFNLRKKS
jgi:hypothetical protein